MGRDGHLRHFDVTPKGRSVHGFPHAHVWPAHGSYGSAEARSDAAALLPLHARPRSSRCLTQLRLPCNASLTHLACGNTIWSLHREVSFQSSFNFRSSSTSTLRSQTQQRWARAAGIRSQHCYKLNIFETVELTNRPNYVLTISQLI